jgi:GNAT superfamily N-acetyltransferase
MARGWIDAGTLYSGIDPETFQVPTAEGLGAWFEEFLTAPQTDAEVTFVAEVEDRVVGFVEARLQPPFESATRQILRELAYPRLVVGALVVEEAFRRRGAGTLLMDAVEAWGRDHGTATASVETYFASPISMPFYEGRMGYRHRSVGFRKALEISEG